MHKEPSEDELKRQMQNLKAISEKNREEIAQLNSLLSAVIDGSESLMSDHGFAYKAHSLFDACKKQIGAQSGYVALLSEEGNENEVLFLDSGELPCSVDPELPMPIRGLREIAYSTSHPAFENDFERSEWAKFLPQGHVTLKNVMFAPIVHDGKTVGVLGLANKPSDFNQTDVRIATVFGRLAAIALRDAKQRDDVRKYQDALLESDYEFNILFNTMTEGVCLHELIRSEQGKPIDYRIINVNPAYERITGLSKDAAIHKNASDLYETGEPPFLDLYARVTETKRSESFEIYWPPMGKHFLISVFSPREGQFATVFMDISGQKEKEKQLQESEEYLSTTLNSIGDAVITTDTHGRVVRMNPIAEKLTGIKLSEARNQPLESVFDIINQKTRRKVENPVEKVLEKGTIVGLANHTVLISKDGKEYFIDDSAAPIMDANGVVAGVVLIFRDITEKYIAEEKLRQSGYRYRQLFEKSTDAIFVVDRSTGRYLNANAAAEKLTGRSVLELKNLTTRDLTPMGASQRLEAIRSKEDTMDHGEVVYVRADGTERIAKLETVPLDSNTIFGIAQDITERKREAAEKEKLQAQLAQAQKMESVGRLAGGVAHDFNNMLSVILGHAEMILEEMGQDQPIYAELQEIQKAAKHSADITRQLLAFARKQTVSPKLLDLNETVESMLRMLGRIIGEDIALNWLPGRDLACVKIDPSQVDQILANLCVNARDAITGPGKLTIERDNITLDEGYCNNHLGFVPGDYVMLAVSDNGCGMDHQTLENIFEPFFTTKGVDKGTGLGLATVYGIVKQNNGFINVYSEPDHGTSFKIYLPQEQAMAEASLDNAKDHQNEHGHGTILLVEDESSILRMTKMMLERMGYQVIPARTPGEAIRLAQEFGDEIHLLLTDVVMPEMNGRDLAKSLLSLYPGLKRLFMSGYTANVIAHHGVLDKGLNFIQKPFSMKMLGARVRESLGEATR